MDGAAYHQELAEKLRDIGGIFIKGTGMKRVLYKPKRRTSELNFHDEQLYKDVMRLQSIGAQMTYNWGVLGKSSECVPFISHYCDLGAYQKLIGNNTVYHHRMVIRTGELVRVSDRTNDEGRAMWAKVVWFARFQVSVHTQQDNILVPCICLWYEFRLTENGNTFSKGTTYFVRRTQMSGLTTLSVTFPVMALMNRSLKILGSPFLE